MSNWTLYTCDLAIDATATSSDINSPGNALTGYECMFASPQDASASMAVTLAYGTVEAIAIANHDLTSSATIRCGSGTVHNVTGYIDEGWSGENASSPVTVTIANGTARKIGCISLLSGASEHKIVLTNCWPTYPLGMSYGYTGGQITMPSGAVVVDRAGGAYKEFSLNVPFANITSRTTGNTENMLEASFLEQYISGNRNYAAGWSLPMWIVTDAGRWHHVQLQYPIDAPIMSAGGRSILQMRFRTVPKVGLT